MMNQKGQEGEIVFFIFAIGLIIGIMLFSLQWDLCKWME